MGCLIRIIMGCLIQVISGCSNWIIVATSSFPTSKYVRFMYVFMPPRVLLQRSIPADDGVVPEKMI